MTTPTLAYVLKRTIHSVFFWHPQTLTLDPALSPFPIHLFINHDAFDCSKAFLHSEFL